MIFIQIFLVLIGVSNTLCKNVNVPLVRLTEEKIIGGHDTTIEEHPYQVAIEGPDGCFGCGGILIQDNAILTAAHCSQGPPYRVRAGTNILETGGVVIPVAELCTHPKYEDSSTYDVSVWRLSTAFNLSSAIKPIKLQPINKTVSTGTLGTITGWGGTEGEEYRGLPKILQEAEIPKIDDELCQEYCSPYRVSERETCYGFEEGGKSTYHGDSGGPLVIDNTLIGITSWGVRAGEPRGVSGFIKVANEEIRNHINWCLKQFK